MKEELNNIEDAEEAQMLGAIELFHYFSKFKDSKFVIAFLDDSALATMLDDLRALTSSGIQFSLVSSDTDENRALISGMQHRGIDLAIVEDCSDLERPVMLVSKGNTAQKLEKAIELAVASNARRVIAVSRSSGLKDGKHFLSHVTLEELKSLLKQSNQLSFDKEILDQIYQAGSKHQLEFSIVKLKRGNIFKELFTHIGTGTLISSSHEVEIRKAIEPDILDISRLLRPGIEDGAILPYSESEVAASIHSFFVYSINDVVIAAAMLRSHGSHNELAKFCTLPRYRGKGKARILAEKMIEESKNQNKKSVFALSTHKSMWRLFTELGMIEVKREDLPETWKKTYDLSRPSKAFQIVF